MTTTTITANQLTVGTRFGYHGEFTVTSIGPTEDGIFYATFDHDSTPSARVFSTDERIVVPGNPAAAALAAMTPDELLDGYAAAIRARDRVIRHGRSTSLRESKEVRAEVELFRTAILDRLKDSTPPF